MDSHRAMKRIHQCLKSGLVNDVWREQIECVTVNLTGADERDQREVNI